MVVLVCLRWLDTFAGIDLGVPEEQFGMDAAIKVLDGPYTFFLASAALLTVPFWQLHDERARRLTRLGILPTVRRFSRTTSSRAGGDHRDRRPSHPDQRQRQHDAEHQHPALERHEARRPQQPQDPGGQYQAQHRGAAP